VELSPEEVADDPNNTRRAWTSLACTALTLPAGMVAGSLVIDWLGYDPNNLENLPTSARLLLD
jgi:hypothetical protein